MSFADYIPIFCGSCILLWVFIKIALKKKRCTLKVPSICIAHKQYNREPRYTPVYEIPWKGDKIQIYSSVYITRIGKIKPAIGKETQLYVNPDNPLDFFSPYTVIQDYITPILVAAVFILMPIYFIFFHTQ